MYLLNTTSIDFNNSGIPIQDSNIVSEITYIFITCFVYLASIFLLGVLLLIFSSECERNRNPDIY